MADTTNPTTASGTVIGEYMLTTVDNPYNPFTEFSEWLTWDEAAGYHTCGLLARTSLTSSELSEVDQQLAIQQAIDQVVHTNASGVHRKIARNS